MAKPECSKHFSLEEAQELVKIYCSEAVQAKLGSNKKSHRTVWKEVSEELSRRRTDWNRTEKQCQDKVKNLKKEFFAKKRLPTGSGVETWPYYEDFANVYGKTAMCDPPRVIDSLDPTTSLQDESAGSATASSLLTTDGAENLKEKFRAKYKRKAPAQNEEVLKILRNLDDRADEQRRESKQHDEDCVSELKKANSHMEKLIELETRKRALEERRFLLSIGQDKENDPNSPRYFQNL